MTFKFNIKILKLSRYKFNNKTLELIAYYKSNSAWCNMPNINLALYGAICFINIRTICIIKI